ADTATAPAEAPFFVDIAFGRAVGFAPMPPSRAFVPIGLVAIATLLTASSPGDADRCMRTKLKLVGKKEAALLACQSKVAAKNDTSGLTDCESRAKTKFSTAFAGPCVGDEMTCESLADDCESAVSSAMTDTFPSPCEAAKRKAARKLAMGELGCYAKAVVRSTPLDRKCLTRVQERFGTAMTKAGTCGDGGSPLGVV